MEKTKLGVSVCLLGMLVFLTGYMGSTALLLVAGYILLREENATLRKYAVYTVVFYLGFMLIGMCTGLLGNIIEIINFRGWMYGNTFYSVINAILSTINYIVAIAQKLVYGLFAFCALFGKTVKIGALDKLIEKHF
ncbi:MAG: hypothetical protein J1E35_07395 [Lachnospiraceae bacterium]|nr:hypothetical protein [Lachnospiraceae bacterium]